MANGIRVAKPGVNALTATSPNDFYLDTNYPLLKVHASGSFSRNIALMPMTIYHNLGYKPFVLVFSQISDNGVISSDMYQHDIFIRGASWEWFAYTKIFTDRIEITVNDTGTFSGTVQGIYYIFKDEVA